jgi:hypothetical protein
MNALVAREAKVKLVLWASNSGLLNAGITKARKAIRQE